MKRHIILAIAAILAVTPLWAKSKVKVNPDYIIATDYMKADGVTDVTEAIQKLIDSNPQRTIYFPDGTYLISKSILTSAEPERSVDLRLSEFAVIKAAPDWNSDDAMIRIGGKERGNNIRGAGSNYGLMGGIIDGGVERETDRNVTGISVDSGRETLIKDVCIKHVKRGIHIKHGANHGSSDADIRNVNIVGSDAPDSVGVLIEGFDNTFSDMRIADVYIGIHIKSGGNSLRNIHPLFIGWKKSPTPDYASSVAFKIEDTHNWLNYCYNDQFATGFEFTSTRASACVLNNCFNYWYHYGEGDSHRAMHAAGKFNAIVTNMTVGFQRNEPTNSVLKADEPGGTGVIRDIRVDVNAIDDKANDDLFKHLDGKAKAWW